jgi:hypothetical protein
MTGHYQYSVVCRTPASLVCLASFRSKADQICSQLAIPVDQVVSKEFHTSAK